MNKPAQDKLKAILSSSKWTQQKLANVLGVTFATLNSWVNGNSQPRKKAVQAIEDLYLDIVGREDLDQELLSAAVSRALSKKITVSELINNEDLLSKITLYLTYHTNTIEGSTMTLKDVDEVLADDKKVLSNKSAIEQAEARNHRSAMYFLLDELNDTNKQFRWTERLIKNTHLRLMNTIISSAGEYRNHGVRIMGSNTALANHLKIDDLMRQLTVDLNTKSNNPVRQMAELHTKFENIHPFSDGNGRTGRLIIFIQALHYGLVPPLVRKERKQAYYNYLHIADTGNSDLLTYFLAESILATDELMQ